MQPVRLRKARWSAVWQEAHVRQAAPRGRPASVLSRPTGSAFLHSRSGQL